MTQRGRQLQKRRQPLQYKCFPAFQEFVEKSADIIFNLSLRNVFLELYESACVSCCKCSGKIKLEN